MTEWENKISVHSLLIILIVVVILVSVIQVITVSTAIGNLNDKLEMKESATDGKVKLYVMPKPVSENAQVKLNVINGGGN